MAVNERIPRPRSPGDWVTESSCCCGATYKDHRSDSGWTDAVQRVRAANGGWHEGGGYRSRGTVLWAMKVLKLESWYRDHYLCGEMFDPQTGRCDATDGPAFTPEQWQEELAAFQAADADWDMPF